MSEEYKQGSNIDRHSDQRFDFDNNMSKPGTNTDDISRAEEESVESEYIPKTEEEVADHIDTVIGDMLI